ARFPPAADPDQPRLRGGRPHPDEGASSRPASGCRGAWRRDRRRGADRQVARKGPAGRGGGTAGILRSEPEEDRGDHPRRAGGFIGRSRPPLAGRGAAFRRRRARWPGKGAGPGAGRGIRRGSGFLVRLLRIGGVRSGRPRIGTMTAFPEPGGFPVLSRWSKRETPTPPEPNPRWMALSGRPRIVRMTAFP